MCKGTNLLDALTALDWAGRAVARGLGDGHHRGGRGARPRPRLGDRLGRRGQGLRLRFGDCGRRGRGDRRHPSGSAGVPGRGDRKDSEGGNGETASEHCE